MRKLGDARKSHNVESVIRALDFHAITYSYHPTESRPFVITTAIGPYLASLDDAHAFVVGYAECKRSVVSA